MRRTLNTDNTSKNWINIHLGTIGNPRQTIRHLKLMGFKFERVNDIKMFRLAVPEPILDISTEFDSEYWSFKAYYTEENDYWTMNGDGYIECSSQFEILFYQEFESESSRF